MEGEQAVAVERLAGENVWAPVSVMLAVFTLVIAFIPWLGPYVAWLPGGFAVGTAVAGIVRARRLDGQRRGMAIGGLFLAILAILVSLRFWILILILGSLAEGS